MPSTRRLQATSAVGALLLLGGAWAVTVRQEAPGTRAEQRGAVATSTTTDPTRPAPGPSSTTTTAPAEAAVEPAEEEVPTEVRAGLTFTDATAEAGFDAPQAKVQPTDADVQTGGVAVADYDDDGDQDVLLTRVGLPNRLLRNDGTGSFRDVAGPAGLAEDREGSAAAVWADVDGDGDLDLFLTGAGRGRSKLHVNDGEGTFTEEAAARGIDTSEPTGLLGTATYGAAFDDWDHDGDLDLVVVHWFTAPVGAHLQQVGSEVDGRIEHRPLCELTEDRRARPPVLPDGEDASRSRLYRNDGTGRFADVTEASGIDWNGIVGFQPQFADADGDGWNDLFITGDVCTSRLYRNLGGRGFADVTEAAGLGTDENGMGSVVEDLDGDGHLDWFITSIAYPTASGRCPATAPTVGCSGNRLFLGDGRGRFTDATDRFGVRDGLWGWGALGEDLNDDGRRDLLVVNGMSGADGTGLRGPDGSEARGVDARSDLDPNRLWLATADGPWALATEAVGLRDRTNGKGVVAFDAEGDGDLDVLVATTGGPPRYYRNDTPVGSNRHRLTLRLRDPGGPNTHAVGAEVRVDLGDGSPPRRSAVRAGGSFQSGDPTDLHVGLGAVDRVARIEVRWPGQAEPQVLTDVAADQVLVITRRP